MLTDQSFQSEKILLLRVSEGNESAFRLLYHQWQPQLASYIYRITKSQDLSAEIVQDVFMKIWMNREVLAEINSFKAYLFVISRNYAINALRKALREYTQFKDWEKENSTETIIESDDTKNIHLTLIDEAIDHLPTRQKEVYLLHRHEGLTYQEIATKLGIGKESVKTHLELSIKAITKYVKDHLAILALLIEYFSKNS